MALSRMFMWLAVGSVIAFAVGITVDSFASGLFPAAAPMYGQICGVLTALGLAGAACASARLRGRFPRFMSSGLIAASMAAAGWITLLPYFPYYGIPQFVSWWLVPLTTWACLMVLLSALAARRAEPTWLRWLRRGAIAMAGTLAFVVAASILGSMILPSDPPWQQTWLDFMTIAFGVAGVLGAVTMLLFLLVSLATIVPHLRSRGVPDEQRLDVHVVCPRCGVSQTIRSEGDACRRCRLRISVMTA